MYNYIDEVLITESSNFGEISERLRAVKTIRLLHAAMGLSTESGEMLDALKKYIFYGKALDEVNLQEELGDIFWYAAILANACGFTFEDTMEKNIAKLRARYPNKFSERDAIVRDLALERYILERRGITSDFHKPEHPSQSQQPERVMEVAQEILSQFHIYPGRK